MDMDITQVTKYTYVKGLKVLFDPFRDRSGVPLNLTLPDSLQGFPV